MEYLRIAHADDGADESTSPQTGITRQKRHCPSRGPCIHFGRLLNSTVRNLGSPRWALEERSRDYIWDRVDREEPCEQDSAGQRRY
jgi:hypothetical protein